MADRSHKSRQKLTFRMAVVKPRNPLVAAAIKRAAGPHRKSTGAQRAAERAGARRAVRTGDDEDG